MGNKSRNAIKPILYEWNLQLLKRQAFWVVGMVNTKKEAIHSE
jgi:hypothetical protein